VNHRYFQRPVPVVKEGTGAVVDEQQAQPDPQFTTDEMGTGQLVHPWWCDAESCTVDGSAVGTHNSRTIDLVAERPSSLGVAITLSQGMRVPGFPRSGAMFVDLTFLDVDSDPDSYGVMPLDVGTAQRLGQLLAGGPETIANACQAGKA
jgi:hypothetical protein